MVPEKAAVIQRIFRETIEGVGLQMIARNLNLEGVPMLRAWNQKCKIWTRSLIRNYLHSTRVTGTYTPCKGEMVNGKVRFMPAQPKLGYYPEIVSQADWDIVRDRRVAWAEHHKCAGRRMAVANVLSQLAKCPFCGRAMVLMRTENQNQRYMVCMAWREGRACSKEWVRFPEVEDVFLSDVNFLIRGCPQPQLHVDARRIMLKTISKRLSHLRGRLLRERAAHDLLADAVRGGRAWPEETEAEMDGLVAERYRLRLNRNYWEDATLNLKLEALRAAVQAEPRDLARINDRLRALLIKVVVEWEKGRLVLHWRHGGQSYADFWNRRQKGSIRNTSRTVEATRHRPLCYPPGDTRGGEIFEGEFAVRVLDVLRHAGRPLAAREIALGLAAAAGHAVPEATALIILMAKVRRTFSYPRGGAVREGVAKEFRWRLA